MRRLHLGLGNFFAASAGAFLWFSTSVGNLFPWVALCLGAATYYFMRAGSRGAHT